MWGDSHPKGLDDKTLWGNRAALDEFNEKPPWSVQQPEEIDEDWIERILEKVGPIVIPTVKWKLPAELCTHTSPAVHCTHTPPAVHCTQTGSIMDALNYKHPVKISTANHGKSAGESKSIGGRKRSRGRNNPGERTTRSKSNGLAKGRKSIRNNAGSKNKPSKKKA